MSMYVDLFLFSDYGEILRVLVVVAFKGNNHVAVRLKKSVNYKIYKRHHQDLFTTAIVGPLPKLCLPVDDPIEPNRS
jgi:hypothetical protein